MIGFVHRNLFHLFAYTLQSPYLGLLFICGLVCAILKLNATCYLYGHKINTKYFIIDVLMFMLFILIFGFIFGTMVTCLILSSDAIFIKYIEYILRFKPDFMILHLHTTPKMIGCVYCAEVGIESVAFSGKRCEKCGVSAGTAFPP